MKHLLFLLLPLVFSAVSFADDAAKAPPSPATSGEIVRILEQGLAPFKRKDMVLERMEDPLLVRTPFVFFHLIFERTYYVNSEEPKKSSSSAAPQQIKKIPRREYADIVFIPKDAPFMIDRALRLTQENRMLPEPYTDLFFSKYGIRWNKAESDYHSYVLYLGEDDTNYYFGHANLTVLVWFARAFNLKNGFDIQEVLAKALEVEDSERFTSRYAIMALASRGNAALPYLKKSVESFLETDVAPAPAFICMKMINTPEADRLMCSYARSRDDLTLNGLFQAFADFSDMRLSHKEIFFAMVRTRMAPVIAVQAAEKLHFEKELIPYLQDHVNRPRTFEEYAYAVRAILHFMKPELRTPHAQAAEQIHSLLLRGGDVPNTLRVINVQEKVAQREERLAGEDAERIKPFADMIVQSPETSLSILTALELAMYDPPRSSRISSSYVNRVRSAGCEILRRLPQNEVRKTLRGLLNHLVNSKERDLADDAWRKCLRGAAPL